MASSLHILSQFECFSQREIVEIIIIFIIIFIKQVLLVRHWVKITPTTLYKWNYKIKSGKCRWEKVKMMTWRKDAFSGDAWRCRVSQTQWRWMAKCSRRTVLQRRMHDLQSSYDTKMAWQGQTSSSSLCPPQDVARSQGICRHRNTSKERTWGHLGHTMTAVSYIQPLPGHASSHRHITTSAIEASVLQAPACGTVYHRACDETIMNFARFKRQLKTFLFGS